MPERTIIHDYVNIGNGVSIGDDTVVEYGSVLSDNVKVGNNCVVPANAILPPYYLLKSGYRIPVVRIPTLNSPQDSLHVFFLGSEIVQFGTKLVHLDPKSDLIAQIKAHITERQLPLQCSADLLACFLRGIFVNTEILGISKLLAGKTPEEVIDAVTLEPRAVTNRTPLMPHPSIWRKDRRLCGELELPDAPYSMLDQATWIPTEPRDVPLPDKAVYPPSIPLGDLFSQVDSALAYTYGSYLFLPPDEKWWALGTPKASAQGTLIFSYPM